MKDEFCRFCKTLKKASKCYEHCHESQDGKHVPDPKGITVPTDAADWVVDVSCLRCGISGGVTINPDEVDFGH